MEKGRCSYNVLTRSDVVNRSSERERGFVVFVKQLEYHNAVFIVVSSGRRTRCYYDS